MNKKDKIFWRKVNDTKKYLPLRMTIAEARKLTYIEMTAWIQMLNEDAYNSKPKKVRDFEKKVFADVIKRLKRDS